MRATLILLFVALGFQASAETRAECSVTSLYELEGAELTERSDLPETVYIQYNEETLSLSDGKFPMTFNAVSSEETAGFLFSREFISTENGMLTAAVIMNPACRKAMTASGTLRALYIYAIKFGKVYTMSADCSCPS